jgi:hypothetical protein
LLTKKKIIVLAKTFYYSNKKKELDEKTYSNLPKMKKDFIKEI